MPTITMTIRIAAMAQMAQLIAAPDLLILRKRLSELYVSGFLAVCRHEDAILVTPCKRTVGSYEYEILAPDKFKDVLITPRPLCVPWNEFCGDVPDCLRFKYGDITLPQKQDEPVGQADISQ